MLKKTNDFKSEIEFFWISASLIFCLFERLVLALLDSTYLEELNFEVHEKSAKASESKTQITQISYFSFLLESMHHEESDVSSKVP